MAVRFPALAPTEPKRSLSLTLPARSPMVLPRLRGCKKKPKTTRRSVGAAWNHVTRSAAS